VGTAEKIERRLDYNDNGRIVAIGPGDIVFSASNVSHGLNNVGTADARYIVFSEQAVAGIAPGSSPANIAAMAAM
jgi:mannose-6-phosphate isomerase-like protein (cupin superfamily)